MATESAGAYGGALNSAKPLGGYDSRNGSAPLSGELQLAGCIS